MSLIQNTSHGTCISVWCRANLQIWGHRSNEAILQHHICGKGAVRIDDRSTLHKVEAQ